MPFLVAMFDVTERRTMMPVGARFFGRIDTFIIGSCRIDCPFLYFQAPARPFSISAQPALLQAGKGRFLHGQHGRTAVISATCQDIMMEALLELMPASENQAAANEPWPEVQAPAADGGGDGGSAPFPAQIP